MKREDNSAAAHAPASGNGTQWAMDSRITPIALTLIVLVSVASGALIARMLLARRPADKASYDRESGEPLFI